VIKFAFVLLSLAMAASAAVPSQPVVIKTIAPPAAWKKLKDRVLKRPGVLQDITVEGAPYSVLSVVSKAAFSGQDCPAGTEPRSAVHFTVPAPAEGAGIYPVRLTASCVASGTDSSSRDLLAVDADADGKILDIAIYNGSLGVVVHPTAEPVPNPGDTQVSNLATMLGRLVQHLTETP